MRVHARPGDGRSDDFEGFFRDRKSSLLALIERAMGKQAIISNDPPIEDAMESNEETWQETSA